MTPTSSVDLFASALHSRPGGEIRAPNAPSATASESLPASAAAGTPAASKRKATLRARPSREAEADPNSRRPGATPRWSDVTATARAQRPAP